MPPAPHLLRHGYYVSASALNYMQHQDAVRPLSQSVRVCFSLATLLSLFLLPILNKTDFATILFPRQSSRHAREYSSISASIELIITIKTTLDKLEILVILHNYQKYILTVSQQGGSKLWVMKRKFMHYKRATWA